MRVTSMELHPVNSSDVFVLSFRDPTRSNPYNVKEVTGLDPDVITSKYYGVSGTSNDRFYALSVDRREIGVRVGLNPVWANQSYSDLRDALYRMISSSRTGLIEIQFRNETGIVAVIQARVTKVESPQFSRDPDVLITFEADNPMLTAPDEVEIAVAGLDPAGTNVYDVMSTAPHGFDFTMAFLANLATLTITDPFDLSWSFAVSPAGGFLTGDVLHFSSEPKAKQLYITRGAATIYLADKIAPGSVWPVIFPGDNNFAVASPTSVQWTSITYFPTFWGV